jgi:hypothetical protein
MQGPQRSELENIPYNSDKPNINSIKDKLSYIDPSPYQEQRRISSLQVSGLRGTGSRTLLESPGSHAIKGIK